jgi:hypothetical protein
MKMKLLFGFFLMTLAILILLQGDCFSILPQPVELKQWIFILVTISISIISVVLRFEKNARWTLPLFFVAYPIIAQSAFYLNLATPSFILTPTFAYLTIHLLLSKRIPLSGAFRVLLVFCGSTIISVLLSENPHIAFTFFVLGVGGFSAATYLTYWGVLSSRDPIVFIRTILIAIIIGSTLYFLIETAAFRIRPRHIVYVLRRQWYRLPLGRSYTGGYKEPAGLGFVYSVLFWPTVLILQIDSTKTKWRRRVDALALLVVLFFVYISGTRSAIMMIADVLIVLIYLLIRKKFFKLRMKHIILALTLILIGAYALLPRTIMTARSDYPDWYEPTYVSLAGRSFPLVGTTASYVELTRASWKDFLYNPLGKGPLNATPIRDDSFGGHGRGYYFSIITDLIVWGAMFGWLSLLIWIAFILYLFYQIVHLNVRSLGDRSSYLLSLVFLAILLGSLLPGSYRIGPGINWSEFSRTLPISPETPKLPGDYPAVISGVIVGGLLGLLSWIQGSLGSTNYIAQNP